MKYLEVVKEITEIYYVVNKRYIYICPTGWSYGVKVDNLKDGDSLFDLQSGDYYFKTLKYVNFEQGIEGLKMWRKHLAKYITSRKIHQYDFIKEEVV